MLELSFADGDVLTKCWMGDEWMVGWQGRRRGLRHVGGQAIVEYVDCNALTI